MLDPEAEEARQDEIIDRIRQIVEGGGGEFEAVDAWGRRKLAYEIATRARPSTSSSRSTRLPETLDEVTRVLAITDDVMRQRGRARRLHRAAAAAPRSRTWRRSRGRNVRHPT